MCGTMPATSDKHARPLSLRSYISFLHSDDYGAIATEYILILALVVLPIALLFPSMMTMVKTYGSRMTALMGLPFP